MDNQDVIDLLDSAEESDLEDKAPVRSNQDAPQAPTPTTRVQTGHGIESEQPDTSKTTQALAQSSRDARREQALSPDAAGMDHVPELTPSRKKRAVDPFVSMRQLTLVPVRPPSSKTKTTPPPFTRASWPHHVVHVKANYNPDAIVLPTVPTFGSCGCTSACRRDTCRNAELAIYCSSNCCPFSGECGNGLVDSKNLVLARVTATLSLTVLATKLIPKRCCHRSVPWQDDPFAVSQLSCPKPRLPTADAQRPGWERILESVHRRGYVWFLDAFCEPFVSTDTKLHEVSNGTTHTIVVATTREIKAGEEITTDYGDDLWFVCRCGHKSCRHRDIQHLKG